MKKRYYLVVVFAVVCTDIWFRFFGPGSEDEQYCSNPKELESCISPMQSVLDNGEPDLIKRNVDQDLVCSVLNRGLRCLTSYMLRCIPEQVRNYAHQQYHEQLELLSKFCHPLPHQKVWSEDESQDCYNTEELESCLSPVKDMIDKGKFSMAYTKQDLDFLCPDVNRALRCIESYTGRCTSITEKQRNNLQFHDYEEFLSKVCHPGPFQEEFLAYTQCRRQSNYDFEHCFLKFERDMGPSKEMSPESYSKFRTTCCSFRELWACMNKIMAENCGEQQAKYNVDLFKMKHFKILQKRCESFDQC